MALMPESIVRVVQLPNGNRHRYGKRLMQADWSTLPYVVARIDQTHVAQMSLDALYPGWPWISSHMSGQC